MEMEKKEKLTPWNIDTIGQDGFTKTVINTKPLRRNDDSSLSDEEKEKRMKQFVKDHEKKLKEFGMLRRYDDSKKFLQENLHLVCENTANYLVIWCINLEMEEVSFIDNCFVAKLLNASTVFLTIDTYDNSIFIIHF